MFRPRNTLVLIRLIPKEQEVVGKIALPEQFQKQYSQGTVISVGPGTVAAEGGVSETADLKPGQRVLLMNMKGRPIGGGHVQYEDIGVPIPGQDFEVKLYEQTVILGVLGVIEDQVPVTADTRLSEHYRGHDIASCL